MEEAGKDDDYTCLGSLSGRASVGLRFGTAYLNDEDDDGIFGVVFTRIGAFDNPALSGCSVPTSFCRRSGGRCGHGRSDSEHADACHPPRLMPEAFVAVWTGDNGS